LESLPYELLLESKQKGFADRQIAHMVRCLESQVHDKRVELGIERVWKMVDTCAAEFPAQTPYYYSTFESPSSLVPGGKALPENESVRSDRPKVVVLGSGPNRIGQGIEFDYSCVHGVLAAKECGYETIMVNCNPETVSTDFNTADKLYFEPVFWEHLYDILRHEKPVGVVVQLGGQTALKLAEKLDRFGIPILGTTYESLDLAEDRGRFSTLLQEQGGVCRHHHGRRGPRGGRESGLPHLGPPVVCFGRPGHENCDQRRRVGNPRGGALQRFPRKPRVAGPLPGRSH
jgi:carbamoyl-phosphate synthase large subunit